MKKLSVEEKAKRYEEVLAMAKEYVTYIPGDVANYIFNMFPELKESTDEGIRESIAGFLKTISSLKDGQTVSNEDFDTKVILEWVAWLTKQSKQKPQDESAPEAIKKLKYKDGDWIVYDNNVYKIVNIPHDEYYECLGIDNTIRVYDSCIDDKSHLWTIKDAKDGDVLCLGGVIAIFKKYIGQENCICYCSFCDNCYCSSCDKGGFEIPIENGEDNVYGCTDTTPANKEQRDLLFVKMNEAGYEWDKDKKELIKQMTDEEHKQYMLEHQVDTIYDMSFEEAQDYISKRGFDIPWNDGDVMVDERCITQTVANVLKWADRHPLILLDNKEEEYASGLIYQTVKTQNSR